MLNYIYIFFFYFTFKKCTKFCSIIYAPKHPNTYSWICRTRLSFTALEPSQALQWDLECSWPSGQRDMIKTEWRVPLNSTEAKAPRTQLWPYRDNPFLTPTQRLGPTPTSSLVQFPVSLLKPMNKTPPCRPPPKSPSKQQPPGLMGEKTILR